MKKLLFYLVRFPAHGGIETVTDIIGTALVSTGRYSVDVITQINGDKEMELLYHINLFTLPDSEHWHSKKNRNYVRKVMKNGHYDALIYQDSYSGMEHIVCGEAYKYGIPIYVFEHNSPIWFLADKAMFQTSVARKFVFYFLSLKRLYVNRRSKKYLLEHCQKYILLSGKFKKDLRQVLNTEKYSDKIISINNPIIYQPIDKSEILNKSNTILTVCQLNKTKNVSLMLKMWKSVSMILSDWNFVIVGEGSERAFLEKQVKDYNLVNVTFTGFANPEKYYLDSRIFWMTSVHEGWGMTLVEAMQKGCVPIAMNSFSSLTDIVTNGENGFVVNLDDTEGFVNRTIVVARNVESYYKLSSNAINKVRNFDVVNIISQWDNLLK